MMSHRSTVLITLWVMASGMVPFDAKVPPLRVYWNVPSFMCQYRFNVSFDVTKFGILRNHNDSFYGEKISIFYQPGQFPYFKGQNPVWGGIPQLGSIEDHVAAFQRRVEAQLPKDFDGLAVLDFEGYQPIFDLAPFIYRNKSMEYIMKTQPHLKKDKIKEMAAITFDNMAREFFMVLLEMGRTLRPRASFGFYHYPYCRNYMPGHPQCDPKQVAANEQMSWLYKSSGAYFPSIYIYEKGFSPVDRARKVFEILKFAKETQEANSDLSKPILPYLWFKYHDDNARNLSEEDWRSTLESITKLRIDGLVIWGSSTDVNSKVKCLDIKRYLFNVMGPIIKSYTTDELN